MTEQLVIDRVWIQRTRGGERYEIWGHRHAEHATVAVYTFNAWRASLCERARAHEQPVTVSYRPTKYGNELTRVEAA